MATLTSDSEIMKQMIPAVPIPSSSHFQVVHDELHRPMIFSIGNDGIFYLIKADSDGKNQLVNLSEKFKLSRKTLAFCISQDIDHTTYLIVAEEGLAKQGSRIYVMEPTKPESFDWSGPTDLTPFLLRGQFERFLVQRLFLVCIFLLSQITIS